MKRLRQSARGLDWPYGVDSMRAWVIFLTVGSICAPAAIPVAAQPSGTSGQVQQVGYLAPKPIRVNEPVVAKTIPVIPRYQTISIREAVLLANRQGIDNLVASKYIDIAGAEYEKARTLWLPNLDFGTDYLYHTGVAQTTAASIDRNVKQSFMYGGGFNAVFGLTDAIYTPKAAFKDLQAREAQKLAINNDLSLAVLEAYFQVLQYRGEALALAELVPQAVEMVRQTEALAAGLVPEFEIERARVELARRRQVVSTSIERGTYAAAELTRLIRLDPTIPVVPIEAAEFKIQLIDPRARLDDLIPIALSLRPELATQQALVQATLQRLKQEKMRPLMPSLLLRSVSTTPSGTLGFGSFGGGTNGIGDMSGRFDYDIQVIWELQNLGFGNHARVKERRAENEIALLELFRVQDRIAAEVTQAYASVLAATDRLRVAEPAFAQANDNLKKNIEGMTQTRRVGNLLTVIIRPQEVVAAFQAMGQAVTDYYAALADFNRAQFRLYRALGHPIDAVVAGLK